MLDQVRSGLVGQLKNGAEMSSGVLGLPILLVLMLQDYVHVFSDVVYGIAVAHRAITVIAKRVRWWAASATQDTTSEEQRIAGEFRFHLFIESLFLGRAALGALLVCLGYTFLFLLMLVCSLEYLVNVFDETHGILILTF